jgi:Rod binding domain-containing protein
MSEISSIGIPADIQAKGANAVATYKSALQLEQSFLEQLTQAMNPLNQSDDGSVDGTDDSSDDGSDDSSDIYGSSTPYSDLFPNALAQGITDAGGIGLARTLYNDIESKQA